MIIQETFPSFKRPDLCVRSQLLDILCLNGAVFSGKGEGAKYIGLPWVKEQIAKKMGFSPCVGTLNIRLTKNDSLNLWRALKETKAVEISPKTGFSRGKCYRASLADGVECAIVIPEATDYSEDVLEIVAPINLRTRFHLVDGDLLDIEFYL